MAPISLRMLIVVTDLWQSIRHEILAGKILYSPDLWKFFDVYVHLPNFEVGSDAFATFKDLFTRHKTLAAAFFTSNFDVVFAKYNCLLMSENYVTRRQSLKLLGEILLDRSNFDIMMKYIGYVCTSVSVCENESRVLKSFGCAQGEGEPQDDDEFAS